MIAACAALLAGIALAASAPADAQDAPIALVPHRAIYDLSLLDTRGDSQIAAVRGRIVYDFSGSVCAGYSLKFRQVSVLDNGDEKSSTSDLRSTTWESADGKSFKFSSENVVDGTLVGTVEGRAEHEAERTAVELTKPSAGKFDLDPSVAFPTEHMVRAIAAGRAGRTILHFPVYDGSETGRKTFDTLSVVGRKLAPDQRQHDDAAAHEPALAAVPRWPVTISYFARDKETQGGETTPDYAISFELYDNGISRALKLDYNDFIVAGKLVSLVIGKASPCP